MAFLRLPSVWLCFSFFFWSTALAAIQRLREPALGTMLRAMPLSVTACVVTGHALAARRADNVPCRW